MKEQIPNLLTMSRLVISLMIGIPFLILPESSAALVALILFSFGSITDYVDGYLARKWEIVSDLGRMMDPIADKVMVLMLLALLMGIFGLSWVIVIPASVIIFREVLVSGMREFLGDRSSQLQVTKLAKWKTAAQMTAMAVILLGVWWNNALVANLGLFGLWIAALLTGVTGADYAHKAMGVLND